MIPAAEQARLAEFYARHYRRYAAARGVGPDELLGAGRAGAEDAAATFDPPLRRSSPAHAASYLRRRSAARLAGRGRPDPSPAGAPAP
jgi:hypothetical protein